jgi:pyruvate/2-oxoglutarate dehydrogenase complex dihydrolipoamide acyltransferase (E2) component
MASIISPTSDDSSGPLTLVRWLKPNGESVFEGDAIPDIENEKASMEMTAWATGVLWHIAKEGDQLALESFEDQFARIEPKSSDR